MTHGLPPSGDGRAQIPGSSPPPGSGRGRWRTESEPEPQLRGPLAPRPEGWQPPPRTTLAERDDAVRRWARKAGGPLGIAALILWKFGRYVLIALGKVTVLFKIPLLGTVISAGVSIAAYAWIWGWTFAVAIMVTLLVHELGHVVQIRREGMPVRAMNFVPFLGAYVQHDGAQSPDQQARISIAGPVAGALFASLLWLMAGDDPLLRAVAFTGFYLNLLNLLPIGFLDGGGVGGLFTGAWWVVIASGLGAIALASGSAFAAILAIVATVLIYVHRGRGFALDPQDGVPFEQRLNAAALYLGVSAVCAYGMTATYVDRTSVIVQAPAEPAVTAVLR